jgi:putative AdoMet-dependent methyltransferase
MLAALVAKPELHGKVESVCVDISVEPLGKRINLMISAMDMHHVSATTALIQSFADHLKPGGRLALTDVDTEDGNFHPVEAAGVFHRGVDRGELHAVLEICGFGDVNFFTAHTVIKDRTGYAVLLVNATKCQVA